MSILSQANADLYPELPLGHIRLLRIEQPSGRCLFETYQLDQAPVYICVSYTWGPYESTVSDDEPSTTIDGVPRYLNASGQALDSNHAYNEGEGVTRLFLEIDGITYRVSRNVHDMVSRLIEGGTEERFWIDSLCINQADLAERSAQVHIMGDIYRSATNVFVWLGGDELGEAETIISMCQTMSAEFMQQTDNGNKPMSTVRKIPNMFEPGVLESMGLPPGMDNSWTTFARFWDRRWFHRAWIIQEVTLTESPRFWWGTTELDRDMLFNASCFVLHSLLGVWVKGSVSISRTRTREWFSLRRRIGETLGKVHAYRVMANLPLDQLRMDDGFWLKCKTLAGPKYSKDGLRTDCIDLWTNIIDTYRGFNAEDPRDHIYASLGIISAIAARNGLDPPAITVDYSRTVAEVFADAARTIMQASNCVNLVSLAQDPQMRTQPDLPSWVPDFSAPGELPILAQQARRWGVMPKLYHFSQSATEPSAPACFEVQKDLRVLRVKAAQLDEIEAIGESVYEIMNGGSWERIAQLLLSRPQPSSTLGHSSRVETLWRTLCANSTSDGEEIAPPEMASDFSGLVYVSLVMSLLNNPSHLEGLPTWQKLTEMEARVAIENEWAVPVLPSFDELRTTAAEVARRYEVIEAGGDLPKETPVMNRASKFMSAMGPMSFRRLIMTSRGYFGIGPISARAGDQIWVLPSAPLPGVWRRGSGKERYTVLGESYLHGDPGFEEGRGWEWIDLE